MQQIQGIDERELIKRLKLDDQTAFELIFRFYYSGLVIFSKQITNNGEDAEEMVQDFFVQLWENRRKINEVETLKPYFFTSIKNKSLNHLKRRGVEQKIHDYIKKQVEKNILYDPDIYVTSELQEQITRAIDGLPERCREIFVMSRLRGFSNDEIAENFDISKRTVETQISKALRILRNELQNYLGILLFIGMI